MPDEDYIQSTSKKLRGFYTYLQAEYARPGPFHECIRSRYWWACLIYVIYSFGFCIIDFYADVWSNELLQSPSNDATDVHNQLNLLIPKPSSQA